MPTATRVNPTLWLLVLAVLPVPSLAVDATTTLKYQQADAILSVNFPHSCEAAATLLHDVIHSAPSNSEEWVNAYIAQSNCLMLGNRNAEGVVLIRDALTISPSHPRLRAMLGLLYADQGRYDEALPALEAGLSGRRTERLLDTLSLTRFMVGASIVDPSKYEQRATLLDGAAALLEELLGSTEMERRPVFESRLAQVRAAQDRYPEAIAFAEEAVRGATARDCPAGLVADLQLALGQIYYQSGNRTKGLEHMDLAVRLAPTEEFRRSLAALRAMTLNAPATPDGVAKDYFGGREILRIPGDYP